MDELAFGSMMTVPLPGRDGAAGALTMFFNRGGRTHTRDDVLLGMEIASRAAVAVQNARLLRDLRDAVRLRDEFLAMASHELRTPLAAVRLNVETLLLRARREPLSRETLVTKLEGTGRQVTRLAELVDRILDVSRIEAGVLTLERRDCDLADELRGAVAELEPERAQAGSRISVEAPATLLAHLDVTRVRQALRNLVHNALKYGEGRPVSVNLAARDGNAEVRVADQGIGIAAEDQARIFERFTRAAGARHYQGLGVGLFIAREVARAHGGALSVDSVAGAGSTFTLELPLPR
jgi:signal transduction histidine kinase